MGERGGGCREQLTTASNIEDHVILLHIEPPNNLADQSGDKSSSIRILLRMYVSMYSENQKTRSGLLETTYLGGPNVFLFFGHLDGRDSDF